MEKGRPGRKALPEHMVKKQYNVKLRQDQILWLRKQTNAAKILEELIDVKIKKETKNAND